MSDTTAEPSETQIQIGMDPAYKAGSLIAGIKPFSTQGAHQIIDEIKRQIETVRSGDLSRGEAMLVAQAEALDVLFYSYLSQARISKDVDTVASWISLAVKTTQGCHTALTGVSRLKKD
jgi:hypothetical protein